MNPGAEMWRRKGRESNSSFDNVKCYVVGGLP
jgi:hypothetical protein